MALVHRDSIVVSRVHSKTRDCPPTGALFPLRRSPPVKEATDPGYPPVVHQDGVEPSHPRL